MTGDSLTTDIFLGSVLKMKFPFLSLVRYLFNEVSGNRCLTRCSNGNILSITMTGDVSVVRKVLPLVTRPVH